MKSFVALALVGSAFAAPQASGSECTDTRSGSFNLQITNVTSPKRSLERRQLDGTLQVTLNKGVLKDQAGRMGSIVANHQFQFDNPVQNNAIATSGFGICSNGTITHAGSAIWYQCLSGTFYNLYDMSLGSHCNQIYISAVGASTAPVTQKPDGQPGAPTQVPVTQISDGQPQAPTNKPVISQISDGQPQAPTGPVISQISDGQPQAPTSKPTGPLVSQISDGQPQAPTSKPTGPLVSQISDGQPQVPTSPRPTAPIPTIPIITQISTSQSRAPITTSSPSTSGNRTTSPNATAPVQFPGSASSNLAGIGSLAVALFAMFAML